MGACGPVLPSWGLPRGQALVTTQKEKAAMNLKVIAPSSQCMAMTETRPGLLTVLGQPTWPLWRVVDSTHPKQVPTCHSIPLPVTPISVRYDPAAQGKFPVTFAPPSQLVPPESPLHSHFFPHTCQHTPSMATWIPATASSQATCSHSDPTAESPVRGQSYFLKGKPDFTLSSFNPSGVSCVSRFSQDKSQNWQQN